MQQLPASRSSRPQTVKASAKQMFSAQMMRVHGPAGFLMHTVDSAPFSLCRLSKTVLNPHLPATSVHRENTVEALKSKIYHPNF